MCIASSLLSQTTDKEVWLGSVGKRDMFQLYPSTLCDKFWLSLGLELEDPNLTNTTLTFDDSNNLYLVSQEVC